MGAPIRLLVGTTKGLFRLSSEDRESWQLAGPFCDGWPINHAVGDGDRLWAAGGNDWYGARVRRAPDAGHHYTQRHRYLGHFEAEVTHRLLDRLADGLALPVNFRKPLTKCL